jgi:hypothetical protein
MMEVLQGIAQVGGWPDSRPTEKRVVQGNPEIYTQYVGEHRLVVYPERGVVIGREEDRLFLQSVSDGLLYELYAESESRYLMVEREQELTFFKEVAEQVNTLLTDSHARLERAN